MEVSRFLRWTVVSLAVAAAAFVVSLALQTDEPGDVRDARTPTESGAVGTAGVATSAKARHAAAVPSVADAPPAVVEIDDTPLPAGATATIRGTVRDDLGAPVAGAAVSAVFVRRYEFFDVPEPFSARARADGRYAIEDLDPRLAWRVEAQAPQHAAAAPATAVVASGRRLDLTCDFVLERHGAIDVTVLGADGVPVPHEIRVLPLARDDDAWGLDERSLPAGRWRVCVASPGRASDVRAVDVRPGETTRAEFRLADEAAITGALLGEDGGPLENYGVVALPADGSRSPFDLHATTAADGTFRIGGLAHARYFVVPEDPASAADTPGAVLAPASGVRVQLRPEAKARFRVVYPDGFTASDRSADVRVDVTVRGASFEPSPRWDGDVGTVPLRGGEDAEVAVTVVHCLTVRRSVRVRPGETADLGDLRPERAGTIAGRVVDEVGDPVEDALLTCPAADWVAREPTRAGGAFRFDRVPREGCVVDVTAPGRVPVRFDTRGGRAVPDPVVLRRGGELWVRAESGAGAAVRVVDARGEAWPFAADRLDGRGECAARLPPGTWRVEVAGRAPVTADVRGGATTTVRLAARSR